MSKNLFHNMSKVIALDDNLAVLCSYKTINYFEDML